MKPILLFHFCSTSSGTDPLQGLYSEFLECSFYVCSGTQVEHFEHVPDVPLATFMQKNKWNTVTTCFIIYLFTCSAVPHENDGRGISLHRRNGIGGQNEL